MPEFLQNFSLPRLPEITEIGFNHRELLWLIPVLLVLEVGVIFLGRFIRRRRLHKLIGAHLQKNLVENISRHVVMRHLLLWNLAMIFLIIALARPMLAEKEQDVETLGVDVMIALDVSRSMLAEDATMFGSMIERNEAAETDREKVRPSRLNAAKEAIRQFVEEMTGDRVGIIAFAGEARMMAPLTFDAQALNLILEAMSPDVLWLGGTSVSEAIKMAADKLQEKQLDTKVLVIISDGEDLEGDAVITARDAAVRQGLHIFTVGVGSQAGAKIPVRDYDRDGNVRRERWFTSRTGQEVTTRMDPTLLRKLAQPSGGMYVELGPQGEGMQTIYEQGLAPLAERLDTRKVVERVEIFQIPLGIALAILVMNYLLANRKRETVLSRAGRMETESFGSDTDTSPTPATTTAPSAGATSSPAASSVILAGLLCLAFFVPAARLQAISLEQLKYDLRNLKEDAGELADNWNPDLHKRAERLVRGGKPEEAFQLLQNALLENRNDPYLLYNYAIAAAAAGEYGVARTIFSQLANSDFEELSERSVFQLGNLEFKEAWRLRDGSPQEEDTRIFLYEKAMMHYAEAASGTESRGMAKRNIDQTRGELTRLYISSGDRNLESARKEIERSEAQENWNPNRALENLETAKQRFQALKDLRPEKEASKKAEASLEEIEELLLDVRLEVARRKKENLEERIAQMDPQDPQENPLEEEDRARRDEERNLDRNLDRLLRDHDDAIASYDEVERTEATGEETDELKAQAREEQEELRESAAELLQDNAERALAEAAEEERRQDRIDDLSEANDRLNDAETYTPDDEELAAMSDAVEDQLFNELLESGEERLENARQADPERMERMVNNLEQATEDLGEATGLRPENEEAMEMYAEAQEMLAEAYMQRGEENVDNAQEQGEAMEEVAQAIAFAEAAVKDFELAANSDQDRQEDAMAQREEALNMLEDFRTDLTEMQQAEGGQQQEGVQQQQPQQMAQTSRQEQQQWEDLRDLTFDDNMFSYGKAKLDTQREEALKDW